MELKALSPIVKRPSCSLHVFKPEPEKAEVPIVATLEGISMSVSCLLLQKAPLPMDDQPPVK